MKKAVLIFLALAASILLIANLSWGQCPADTVDPGVCDTLTVVPYTYAGLDALPGFAEVLLLATNDIPNPVRDSLAGFVIPLAFTHSNPTKYCSTSAWWNTTNVLYLFPDFSTRSIFRHIVNPSDPSDTIYHNQQGVWGSDLVVTGREWETRILDLSTGTDFRLSVVATGTDDQRWPGGSRKLLATMTFRVEDTMTVCIDSTYWPPTNQFLWSRSDSRTYVPRHSMPICFKVDTADVGVREIPGSEVARPTEFSLSQNYPNPFNPDTYIEFDLSRASHVKIDVFNIVGQRVRTLVDEEMEAGRYVADWDGKDEQGHSVSSGIYFYRLKAADFSDMKKMLLVK
jgi:hypothetical protein